MAAIGYVRQSKRADLDKALSPEAQEAAIRRMAGADVEIVSDLGRSGRAGGERLRPAYTAMVERVTAGDIDHIYVISLSRLSRSVPELHAFMELAKSKGCTIVSDKEGKLDPTTATGKLMFNIWASFAEYVRDIQVEAALENAAIRRSRGEKMGRVPYGERPGDEPDAIIAAWEWLRSLNAVAATLNAEGIQSWTGRDWTGSAVRLVLQRHGLLVNNEPKRGVKPSSPFALFRLLRCPCGRVMTASRDGRGNREPVYRCHAADTLPDHPRPTRVRESVVLPWVLQEADRYRPSADALRVNAEGDEQRQGLERRRGKVIDLYLEDIIDKAERDRRLAKIDDELAKLRRRQVIRTVVPSIHRDTPPEAMNGALRALFEHVQLGADLRPVRARWHLPELRGQDDAGRGHKM